VTLTSAQEQSPSASAATSTESPTSCINAKNEIKKALIRALDTIDEKNKVIAAQDEVTATQDTALSQAIEAKDAYKKADQLHSEAYIKEKEATKAAEDGWADSEKRARQLEKQLRKSDNRVKWMAVGAVAAVVATIFIQR
jgi:ferric-dicitrate binding protein FerR (iron transport regulator)